MVISLTGQVGERAMSGTTEAEKKAAEEKRQKEGPYSIEEVLAAEAKEIHGDTPETGKLKPIGPEEQDKRLFLNEDDRSLHKGDAEKIEPRYEFYRTLNGLNRAALCLSGGGERSAVFCLGVIQALAACDVDKLTVEETAATKPEQKQQEKSLLGRFHYLSTVSGGGYIGSWLSAWRTRNNFKTVIDDLTGRPNGADIEPPPISWLRAYSNYLTPQLGVTSADGWAAVAICVRNLILNWLVIIPIVCLALLVLKSTAAIGVWVAHDVVDLKIMIALALFGAFFLVVAHHFTNSHRPSRRSGHDNAGDWTFVFGDLAWAVLSAILLTIFFSSQFFSSHLDSAVDSIVQYAGLTGVLKRLDVDLKFKLLAMTALAGLSIYTVGWIAGLRFRKGGLDFLAWAASGLVYGALVGLGAYLFHLLEPYPVEPKKLHVLLIAMTLGVPWVLTSQLVAGIVFSGLASYEDKSDPDREWLGRAGGWVAAAAVAWALIAFLVFDGGYFVQIASVRFHKLIVASGGVIGVISGIVTALLGSSSSTAAKSSSKDQGSFKSTLYNVALAVAGPVFVAILIIALSVVLDLLLLGDALVNEIQTQPQPTPTTLPWPVIGLWLGIGLAIAVFVSGLASFFVNINRFSLHALYRNRLIRAYLGASNEERKPDTFSGFDFKDNIRVHELWSKQSKDPAANKNRLFHVINIALNVVSSKRLAWQERKAESFTASPLHCGSPYLGYRWSDEYGDAPKTEREEPNAQERKRNRGIALGTAVAISGAAVSPNMGYHSSPSIALLLTLFNVRLGWWLGNPGKHRYQKDGPQWAAVPLFAEALGLTNDDSPYVYLSDGGHFENLGLYEMVRRRCRLIVLIDAGCDPDFAFEDLGNAVRKIYIDLGICITFKGLEGLTNHPSGKSYSRAVRDAAALVSIRAAKAKAGDESSKPSGAGSKAGEMPEPGEILYHAIGTIDYEHADHSKASENGTIIYIKPAYHGTEGAGIKSYATANPDFPHESTANQWFTESQFESYRSLGLHITTEVIKNKAVRDALRAFLGP
jgi:hypothetical protein